MTGFQTLISKWPAPDKLGGAYKGRLQTACRQETEWFGERNIEIVHREERRAEEGDLAGREESGHEQGLKSGR